MLSQDEQSQLQVAMDAIQRRVSGTLANAQDAWQAISFVEQLHSNTDAIIAASVSAAPTAECTPSCTHCCHARVEVSDPEALFIARHVHQMPTEEKLPLLERLRLKAAESTDLACEDKNAAPQPCAFLRDGLCSIYSIRPSVCRKAHSLSVKACETRASDIPQNLTRVVQCEALLAATNEAFKSVNLPASRYELSAAVLAALAENAEDAWYQGKPLLPDRNGNR